MIFLKENEKARMGRPYLAMDQSLLEGDNWL